MNRFRETKLGYKYDKLLLSSVFFLFLILIVYILYINSFDFQLHPHIICNMESCKNPFYELQNCQQTLKILWVIPIYTTEDCRAKCDWCNLEYLTRGEYGTKPKGGFFINNALLIGFSFILVGLILNHFLHNRGKQFDIEIPITNKIIINRDSLKKWFKENEKNNDNF